MDELYDLEDLSLREIKALRTSLNHLPINGIDAFFIGALQIKLNDQIKQIESHIAEIQPDSNNS
jgi:hypothetical protein